MKHLRVLPFPLAVRGLDHRRRWIVVQTKRSERQAADLFFAVLPARLPAMRNVPLASRTPTALPAAVISMSGARAISGAKIRPVAIGINPKSRNRALKYSSKYSRAALRR